MRLIANWIGKLLTGFKECDEDSEAARQVFLRTPPGLLKERGGYPSRDELHERAAD